MKQLLIPYLPLPAGDYSFDTLETKLHKLPSQPLAHLLWSSNGYKPLVNATPAHNGEAIFLKFSVQEAVIRAVYNNINDPVYKDSCVEFFISLDNNDTYYNLEFNVAGTCYAAYGSSDKSSRVCLPAAAIQQISTQLKMYRRQEEAFDYRWELTVIIPVSVFIHHPGLQISNRRCRINFYKCGDELPQPHFLAWSPVLTDQPNFHLPAYFGAAGFAPVQEQEPAVM